MALSAHESFTLLPLAIPNLQYLLHTAPCYQSEAVVEYDNILRSIMSEVTNMAVVNDHRAWTQASLSVKLGGLGVCSAVEVAPPVYLALLLVTSGLIEAILPVTLPSSELSLLDDVC